MSERKESKGTRAKAAAVPYAEPTAQAVEAHAKLVVPQHGGQKGDEKKNIISQITGHPLFAEIVFAVLLVAFVGGFLYWQDMQGKIYIEKAEISAPLIALAPQAPGPIEQVYVHEGDKVSRGQRLAKVGDQYIIAKTSGVIVWINDAPGQMATAQTPVVEMINPWDLRLIGRIPEDKGLSDIRPGQRVAFTVDAFGAKEYEGVVESIAQSAHQSDVVFSISDKRAEQEFDVKVWFDTFTYSELKNGMSAKMTIHK